MWCWLYVKSLKKNTGFDPKLLALPFSESFFCPQKVFFQMEKSTVEMKDLRTRNGPTFEQDLSYFSNLVLCMLAWMFQPMSPYLPCFLHYNANPTPKGLCSSWLCLPLAVAQGFGGKKNMLSPPSSHCSLAASQCELLGNRTIIKEPSAEND